MRTVRIFVTDKGRTKQFTERVREAALKKSYQVPEHQQCAFWRQVTGNPRIKGEGLVTFPLDGPEPPICTIAAATDPDVDADPQHGNWVA